MQVLSKKFYLWRTLLGVKAGMVRRICFGLLWAFLALALLFSARPAYAGTWVQSPVVLSGGVADASGRLWVSGGSVLKYWDGSAWQSTPTWPGGTSYTIQAITIGKDGKVWAGGTGGYTAYWTGSSWVNTGRIYEYPVYRTINAMTTAPDGTIWMAADYFLYYWNGSNWVKCGQHPNSKTISLLQAGPDGKIWISGSGVGLWYYSGGWVSTGLGDVSQILVHPDGTVYFIPVYGNTSAPNPVYYYRGGSFYSFNVPYGADYESSMLYLTAVVAPDGKLWFDQRYTSTSSIVVWNGTTTVTLPKPSGRGGEASKVLFVYNRKVYFYRSYYGYVSPPDDCYYYDDSSPLYLIPSPNGTTGQLVVKPAAFGAQGLLTNLYYSYDGSTWQDLGVLQGNTAVLTPPPGKTAVYFKALLRYPLPGLSFTSEYSNVYTVPLVTSVSVSSTSGIVQWDQSRGRSYIRLTWPAVPNATGYKLHVFDGYAYRTKDLGNVTSWDSRTAKIFPYPSELPENNSVSTDLFRWDGSGLDFEDTPVRLYRSTVGTGYDSSNTYYFRVTAYNQWMESDFNASSSWCFTALPSATDTQAPSGSVAVLSSEGLKKTYDQNVKVTVNVSDGQSGIYQIFFSNDNVSWTSVYTATKNADNGTSVASYTNTFSWQVTPGAGTKTVYAKVVDAVGNAKVLSDSIALAEDMLPPSVTLQINGGAESTTSPNVTLTLNVQDNASTTSQMQMRFSNDGNLWSPWEPFAQTKTWDLTASAYGGNTSPGVKKVYAQVCDQAQNVALAVAEIGYNPNPPVGTVTIVGGSSGTWNGKAALFTASDAPTLNLNFPGATYVRFDPGTGIWGDWEPYASQKTVYLVKSSGVTRLRVQVKDAYGVASAPQEFLVVVDPTPPVIQYLRGLNGATATTSSSITLEISATDNLPGQLQYQYQINGGNWSSWGTLSGDMINVSGLVSGANKITVSVKDQAGNISCSSVTIFRL